MLCNLEEALGSKLEASNYLYVLCDYETLQKNDITLKDFVKLCKSKDVRLVQYRDKNSSLDMQKENLLFLKENLNIPIIVNNKIELIEFCEGLHLSQEDLISIHKDKKLAVKLLRKRIQKKLLFLSINNEIQILEANDLDLDLIDLSVCENITYLSKISKHPVCKTNEKIKNIIFDVIESSFYMRKRNTFGKN